MNRHVLHEELELPQLSPIESVEDLRRVLAQSIEDIRSRRLHPSRLLKNWSAAGFSLYFSSSS